MREIKFKPLTAEQIEVRPTDTKYIGKCTLLLYIDSRQAASILNETVGVMNWQMEYKDVAGKIYGRLSIWDDERKCWVYKEDTGSEGNIEADKSLSSDILKRCLARWGCDHLYYTPKVRINCDESYYNNGKMTMTFTVADIAFDEDKTCTRLAIVDRYGECVYYYNDSAEHQEGQDIETAQPETKPVEVRGFQPSEFPLKQIASPLDASGRLDRNLYLDIVKSSNVDRLVKIWEMYPQLHDNKLFSDTLHKRKKELKANR